jgi:L-lactate dehydrogenase
MRDGGNMINVRKCAIIGCGFVGASSAFSLVESGLFSELVLIDATRDKAEGEAMDLSHGMPFSRPMEIYAGSYDDIADCGLIIVTAGASQKPNETRMDLVNKNVSIFKSIIPEIKKRACEGILLIVSNPVDILTYVALKLSGLPANRVIGSGTVLDTARLKYLLSQHLDVDSRSVHAFIIGEHGDSELAVWSSANVSGIQLDHFCELCGHYHHRETMQKLYEGVRDSAYEIIKKKGATYYGIAMSVRRIAECIQRNEHSILPISSLIQGHYGLNDICMGVPTILGSSGVEKVLDIPLNEEEQQKLASSADALKKVLSTIDLS